jgi:transcriptional regulator of acetoin/glycerol metabolism
MAAMFSEGALQMPDMPSAIVNHQAIARGLHNLSDMVDAGQGTGASDLPVYTQAPISPVISIPAGNRQAILNALAATKGDRGETARLLGISRTTLFRKMKQYEFVGANAHDHRTGRHVQLG